MLTVADLSFFARNGYIKLPRVVSRKICAELVDETWKLLPGSWRRSNPASWTGDVTDSCHTSSLLFRRGHLKFQRAALRCTTVFEREFDSGSFPASIARDLIGFQLGGMRLRGLYAIAPVGDGAPTLRPVVKPHIEAHPAQLIAMTYLDDVEFDGGGLLVWPGSHRAIYPAMESKLEHAAGLNYQDIYETWNKKAPLEVRGGAGDMIIIHHRLLHAPSLNLSDRIRFAFLCDYQRQDYRDLCTQAPGPLWEDWPSIATLAGELLDGVPDDRPADARWVVPATTPAPRKMKPDQGGKQLRLGLAEGPDPDAIVRRADASRLARMRSAGEYWIQISDRTEARLQKRLWPLGSDLAASGIRATYGSTVLTPQTHHDLICRLPVDEEWRALTIEGLDRPVYMFVMRIELPFENSKVVFRAELDGTQRRVELDLRLVMSREVERKATANVPAAAAG